MKTYRVLYIKDDLWDGKKIYTKEMMSLFDVSAFSIYRDIDTIRNYLADRMIRHIEVLFDREDGYYYFKKTKKERGIKENRTFLINFFLKLQNLLVSFVIINLFLEMINIKSL